MATYLRDTWLPQIATRVRPTTALPYAQLLSLHTMPVIGQVKLAKLRPAHVYQIVDGASASGLSPRTVAAVYRTLHGALAQGSVGNCSPSTPRQRLGPGTECPQLHAPDAAKVGKAPPLDS